MSAFSPLFIVGLPRSGSTLLSKILNDGDTYFSINDLYYIQAAQSIDATQGLLSKREASFLIEKLLEVVETRALENNEFIGQFSFSIDQLNEIRRAAMEQHTQRPYTWGHFIRRCTHPISYTEQ